MFPAMFLLYLLVSAHLVARAQSSSDDSSYYKQSRPIGVAPNIHEWRTPQVPKPSEQEMKELNQKWGADLSFSGIETFAHLEHVKCLTHPEETFDVGIIGAPFDTSVSFRPGARFGPRAIRAASQRQSPYRAFNYRTHSNPYRSELKVLDCGDILILPVDNAVAFEQMTQAYTELSRRRPSISNPNFKHPRLMTLGGDHSVALGALRALNRLYGRPIAVVHFDSHLDTWAPPQKDSGYPWWSEQIMYHHGSVFWMASTEGLIANGSSVHAGLRTRLSGLQDLDDDDRQGFLRISADEIDDIRPEGIVEKIYDRIGITMPVYLSFDIDVIDPGLCPGTGTPEPGGWTTREVIKILRGLANLNVVGADVVEVSPAYDGVGEPTALAAAQVVYEMLTAIVSRGRQDINIRAG